jgi:hypothetical protein
MTTPADELRTAADKVRSLITFLGNNRGPWSVHVPDSGYPQTVNNVGVPYLVATCYEGPEIPLFTIAPYIAAMHPGVGAALADWLDTAAANAAALTWPNDFIERALAVARQINGGTQ